MHKPTILIVDDEPKLLLSLQGMIEPLGYEILIAFSGADALNMLDSNDVDLVLSDQNMPGMDGLELLRCMKEQFDDIPFVMLTGHGSIDKAVLAMRKGAVDYLTKPCQKDELESVITRSMKIARLFMERRELKKYVSGLHGFENIITQSNQMRRAIELAEKVASIPNAAVAIYGESGTGKELLARAIHNASGCLENRFVAVNCAGIPSSLLESELYGHVKGAFTGADFERDGKFGMAQNGTMLLDEIGDMPIDIQPNLLRVLEERCYEKVGSDTKVNVDFRVIATTHHHLEKLIIYGKFRRDLFHRINRFPIFLPPLCDRKEDIPLLVNHFIEIFHQQLGKPIDGISKAAMNILKNHHWPGNVRELKNILERAAIVSEDKIICPASLDINQDFSQTQDEDFVHLDIKIPAQEFSLNAATEKIKDIILNQCDGNKSKAAEMLKVNRKLFYRK
jgi:DNA-binding NtrC family response regulator